MSNRGWLYFNRLNCENIFGFWTRDKALCKMKMANITTITCALATIPNSWVLKKEKLPRKNQGHPQESITESIRLIRRLLEYWGDLLSLYIQRNLSHIIHEKKSTLFRKPLWSDGVTLLWGFTRHTKFPRQTIRPNIAIKDLKEYKWYHTDMYVLKFDKKKIQWKNLKNSSRGNKNEWGI